MIEQFGFTSLREVIAALFLLSGLVFFVGSAIGMLRLPDFYSRIHASGHTPVGMPAFCRFVPVAPSRKTILSLHNR